MPVFLGPRASAAPRAAALGLALAAASVNAAPPSIELELIMEDPYGQEWAQRWSERLREVPALRVRLRAARASDRPKITERGSEGSRSFQVVGVLTARGQLELPGAKSRLSSAAAVQQWADQLRNGGAEGFSKPRLAYGLSSRQLLAVHAQLKPPVTFSTKGKTVGAVGRQIAALANLQLESDPEIRGAAGETVPDELQGLSAGTALAAALRPAGLVLTLAPRGENDVAMRIRDSRAAKEFWPIGWPTEKNLQQAAPDLFKYLDVEINRVPAAEAIEAIRPRLSIALLTDYNSLLREQIDLTKERVSIKPGRSFYINILDQVFAQSLLTSEAREDEAGKVFLWITTVRQER